MRQVSARNTILLSDAMDAFIGIALNTVSAYGNQIFEDEVEQNWESFPRSFVTW